MTENKRFTIKIQDDYFGITDNSTADKVNVVNGIRTEIEAEWLCDLLNGLVEKNKELQDFKDLWVGQNSILERENKALIKSNQELTRKLSAIKIENINKIIEQNKELKKQNDILIKQRFGEEQLKQEIADYHKINGKLHRVNIELIKRLDEFNINYLDILRNWND